MKKYTNYATPTGQIGMSDVRTELGKTGQISLNDTDVRKLAGKTSGQIAMSDLRGKSNATLVYKGIAEGYDQDQMEADRDLVISQVNSKLASWGIAPLSEFGLTVSNAFTDWGTKVHSSGDQIKFSYGRMVGYICELGVEAWKFE